MPVYEYICGACRERFEQLVSMADRDGVSCPECGSGQVQRAISVFAAREGLGRDDWMTSRRHPY